MTNNYILILVWILILGVFSCFVNVNRKELVCGKEENRCYWMWAIIVFLPLIIWCGKTSSIVISYGRKEKMR